jgi:hypothetical protein
LLRFPCRVLLVRVPRPFWVVSLPSVAYQPKSPTQTVLHRLVLEHLETFLAEAERARNGGRLPGFVEDEFRQFLTCGLLAGGFARAALCRAV